MCSSTFLSIFSYAFLSMGNRVGWLPHSIPTRNLSLAVTVAGLVGAIIRSLSGLEIVNLLPSGPSNLTSSKWLFVMVEGAYMYAGFASAACLLSESLIHLGLVRLATVQMSLVNEVLLGGARMADASSAATSQNFEVGKKVLQSWALDNGWELERCKR
jgi:hypothetical protein